MSAAATVTLTSQLLPVHLCELGDDDTLKAMDHLRVKYSNIDGLQHPSLGVCVAGLSVPQFHPVIRPFVEVFNVGDYLMTATNRFTVVQR